MARKFGKDKKDNSKLHKSFRKSQAWRYLSRKDNADNFEGRTVFVAQKGLSSKELPDSVGPNSGQEDEDLQSKFVGNTIKSSKYTIFTFLPRNLFEQFRRVGNLYFLFQAIIQILMECIEAIQAPPVSPFTSVAPLVFVVTMTMLKQGYEDFKRHRADRVINLRKVTKLQDRGVIEIQAQEIQVGDILCLEDGDEFPCDLVLLGSSNSNGKASVLTANLDGETNLKNQIAPALTRHYRSDQLMSIRAQIECENPNPDLHGFVGRMTVEDQTEGETSRGRKGATHTTALGPENIVLRGTKLKNTDSVYGCVVYTGPDTKMSQNSQKKGNKFSSIEQALNKYLLMVLLLLFAEILLSIVLKYTWAIDGPNSEKTWYLNETVDDGNRSMVLHVIEDFASFLVLYNYIIPISLYVTIEFQKFCGAFLLAWDLELYDESTDQPAKCNTSDLMEELGQVEYLFSDKTGTLTENVMIFKECSIGGVTFKDQMENLICTDSSPTRFNERSVRKFLEVLALCHTVQATKKIATTKSKNPLDLVYNAASPDEKAIVEACRNYGVAFLGEKEKDGAYWYKLLTSRESRTHKTSYERLHVLEFDSNRKCMSVILRDSNGTIRLVCKGAESSIFPKCNKNIASDSSSSSGRDMFDLTMYHINDFASRGLRTLAAASKTLNEDEYKNFRDKFEQASQALDKREQRIKQVYDEMEDDLELLGAIGIEDKLQENVKETLIALGDAGIKVWVLTGDKKETAINISQSCGHFLPSMSLIDISGLKKQDTEKVMAQKLEQCSESKGFEEKVLIVDGKTLLTVFGKANLIKMLRSLTRECRSVICCRMSPLQKAEIVNMIKTSDENPVTAAVGDGANDVAMIQEAHVGLGIAGKEGRAAVRSSDYAFSKFKHLKRVLLVHGHWYYHRAGNLVQYFFYKNIACFTAQLYFAFFCSFSTQTLFDEMNLTMYNIIYTSLPVFIFGLFEKSYSEDKLLNTPELYKTISKNALLSKRVSAFWFFDAVWSSILCFFAFYLLFIHNSNEYLEDNLGMLSFGFSVYQCVVVAVSFRLLASSRYWNYILLLSIFLSLIAFLIFNLVYHSLVAPFNEPNSMLQVIFHVLKSPNVWLTTLLCMCLALLPYILTDYVSKVILPSLFRKGNENSIYNDVANDNVNTISDKLHDQTKTSGISIIGRGTSYQQGGNSRDRNGNTKNEGYFNSAYISEEVENTRL